MWNIRPEKTADHAQIADVVARAFGSQNEARLVEAIRGSENYVPDWALVAAADGRIVGNVMVSFVGLRDGDRELRVPTLSPLAVDPSHHGHGIGSELVREVTRRVDDAGEPLIVLEGSPVYYARFGFVFAEPLGITIDLPEWAPREAAQVMKLRRYRPSVRGHVVYPAAFADVT